MKKVNIIVFGLIILLLGIVFFQQNRYASLKEDKSILELNADSIERVYQNDLGEWHHEKTLYIEDLETLKEELKLEKEKDPIVITKWKTQYVDTIIEVPQIIYVDSSNYDSIKFIAKLENIKENGNSYVKISEEFPFNVKHGVVTPGQGMLTIEEQLYITALIYKDKNDSHPYVDLTCDMPGVTFTGMYGKIAANMDKKTERSFRKNWSIGLSLTAGPCLTPTGFNYGIMFGPSITYSPRWAQW